MEIEGEDSADGDDSESYDSSSVRSNVSALMHTFKQRRQLQKAKASTKKYEANKGDVHWPLYMKSILQIVATGTVAGSGAHFGYTHALGAEKDLIADTLRGLFVQLFWIYIKPSLCDSVGECRTIAIIQLFRMLTALGTVASEISGNSPMVSITSGVFINLEPMFPLVVPILARITNRDMHILMFGCVLCFGGLCAAMMLMVYYLSGPLQGMVVQVCILMIAFASAVSLREEETALEFPENDSEYENRQHLFQTYLWCCVFPVGATTTFIWYDGAQLWGLGFADHNWSAKKVDLLIAKLAVVMSITALIATSFLHCVIPSKGEPRLKSLIWWSSYYMTAALVLSPLTFLAKEILGVDHILFSVISGYTCGMFLATPDVAMVVESSFGADDFASLCISFEIVHNVFSWLFSSSFRVLILLGIANTWAYKISVLGCLNMLVVPYIFVILNLFYDPNYIYQKDENDINRQYPENRDLIEKLPKLEEEVVEDNQSAVLIEPNC